MTIKEDYTIQELNEILRKARMSQALRRAIIDIKKAMINNDPQLVSDLSTVKSFIISKIEPENKLQHFQEDAEYNEKVLGTDIYTYLDGLHYKYASMTGVKPLGMMVFTTKGRNISKRKHPIIKLMEDEDKVIRKMIKEKYAEQPKKKVVV